MTIVAVAKITEENQKQGNHNFHPFIVALATQFVTSELLVSVFRRSTFTKTISLPDRLYQDSFYT